MPPVIAWSLFLSSSSKQPATSWLIVPLKANWFTHTTQKIMSNHCKSIVLIRLACFDLTMCAVVTDQIHVSCPRQVVVYLIAFFRLDFWTYLLISLMISQIFLYKSLGQFTYSFASDWPAAPRRAVTSSSWLSNSMVRLFSANNEQEKMYLIMICKFRYYWQCPWPCQ